MASTEQSQELVCTKLTEGGRVVIPAEHRRALKLSVGDELVMRVVDNELRILTRAEAVRRAQTMVRRHVKKGHSLVDALSAERRKAGARSD